VIGIVQTPRQNAIGVLAMLGSMAAFVVNDVAVKIASDALPLGEIIALRNLFSTLALTVVMFALPGIIGPLSWPRRLPGRLIALRVFGEIVATILFLAGLVALSIGDVTAIAQVAPLGMTAAAALFLGERVGWRRWTATVVGFLGVALIVRPGSAAFSVAGAMVLLSVLFVVVRDLATRLIPPDVSTGFIGLTSTVSGIAAGILLLPFEIWLIPTAGQLAVTALSGIFLALAFALLVVGLRTGDVSIVSPFRYTVIVFALIAGYVVWGDTPDGLALLGTAIVCGAGLYTLHRERARQRIAMCEADR